MGSRELAKCIVELGAAFKDCKQTVALFGEWHKAIVGLRNGQ